MNRSQQLYFGGKLVTMDHQLPFAEAMAVKDGQIIAVGDKSHCRSQLDRLPQEIDLQGQTVLPGFIDTHIHPTMMILYELYTDVAQFDSLGAIQAELKKVSSCLPESEWVVGLQFEEHHLDRPTLPTRHDLDQCCPNHPALLLKRDGHSLVTNTKAIDLAGVTRQTRSPEGGSIDREADGFPIGSFRESAMQLILSKLTLPAFETITKSASAVFKRITSFGITSAGVILQTDEEGFMGEQGRFDIPLMELVADRIPISMYMMLVARNAQAVLKAKSSFLHQEEKGAGHRIGALKFWADGSFASCTAKMKDPFSDHPETSGYLIEAPEQLYDRMADAHKAGLQLAIHSIGDESTRICLELFDRLLHEFPARNHRHRLEHASILDEPSIKKMARLGLVASVQPLFIHSEKNWLQKRLGTERIKHIYPFRSFIDNGVIVAGSSDAPIETMNALHAIQCCVTREGFEIGQSISLEQAISMFTLNAAYAQFEETVKGSITTGKRADFVILGANPFDVPAATIQDISVEQTICGGKPCYP